MQPGSYLRVLVDLLTVVVIWIVVFCLAGRCFLDMLLGEPSLELGLSWSQDAFAMVLSAAELSVF